MGPGYIVYEEITNKSGLNYTNVSGARGHTCFKDSEQKDYSYIYFYLNYSLIQFLH